MTTLRPDPATPPHFIVIGAQKSASTFLQACLTEHPAIWMPLGETPYFESPDYEGDGPQSLLDVFAGRDEPCLGIKRPNYIGKPEVPARIAADRPDAKLIAVLRDPVARALSAYYHLIKAGFTPAVHHEQGLADLLDDGPITHAHPRLREVLTFGLYHHWLSLYTHHRNAGLLLIKLHDDVLADPREVVREVYHFLDVDDSFVPEQGLSSRPQAVVYQLARLRLLSKRPRLLYRFAPDRSRMVGRHANPLRKAAAAAVVATDRHILARVFGNDKPKLSDTLRQRLQAYYAADVRALEDMLQRDLSHWVPRETVADPDAPSPYPSDDAVLEDSGPPVS